MKDKELKPCPFCGDDGVELAMSAVPSALSGGNKQAVFCNMCFAEGPTCEKEDDAIEAWNHRAEEKGIGNTAPNNGSTLLQCSRL